MPALAKNIAAASPRGLQAILASDWDSSAIFHPRYPQGESTISCGYKSVAIYALTNLSGRPTVFLMLRRRLDRRLRGRFFFEWNG